MGKLKEKYAGKRSKKFWDAVNNSPKNKNELYSLGVVLQNLEDYVLKRIKDSK